MRYTENDVTNTSPIKIKYTNVITDRQAGEATSAKNRVWQVTRCQVAVLEKHIGGGAGPSSFGRQQQLCEITIEPIKNWGDGQDLGACAPPRP